MSFNNILFWFGIYLITGVVALLAVRLWVRMTDKPDPRTQWVRDVVRMVRELPGKTAELKKNRDVLIFAPWILLFWPLAFVIGVKERISPTVWKPNPEDAFACHRQHLVRLVSPDAAQADAKVADPLGRVPDLPFGHLNAGWCAFLAGRQPKDKLWYFEIPGYTPGPDDTPQRHEWSVPRGAKRGYAWVRSRKVRAEFVFEWD